MLKISLDKIQSLFAKISENAKLYPGYFLTKGQRSNDVSDLQTYLNFISNTITQIPQVSVTGYYGDQTQAAVSEFQRLFGLDVSGSVGPVTWYQIAREYDALKEQQQ